MHDTIGYNGTVGLCILGNPYILGGCFCVGFSLR